MSKAVKTGQPCPCGRSSDAVTHYDNGWARCFSGKCGGFNFRWGVSEEEEVVLQKENKNKVSVEEILNYPIKGNAERRLIKAVMEYYGVRCSFKEDGSVERYYFPFSNFAGTEITGYKTKSTTDKKAMWVTGTVNTVFGIEHFLSGGKRIILTEGEEDALAVQTANYLRWKKFYPVISMGSATQTKFLLERREDLLKFEEILLWFDNDEEGRKAVDLAAKILGYERIKIIRSEHKDANDTLKAGDTLEKGASLVLDAVFSAQEYNPSGILRGEQLWAAVEEYNSKESVPYPECLSGLNEKLKGIRTGEISLFTSGTGCFAKGTEVLMVDGSIIPVENIRVGDKVQGPDSLPRTVIRLWHGIEPLYKITLRDGTSFVVNEGHKLALVNINESGRYGLKFGQLVRPTIKEFLGWSKRRQYFSKIFKANCLEFEGSDPNIDPYMLGVWLGDGKSNSPTIYTQDKDVNIIKELIRRGYPFEKKKAEFAWSAPYGRLSGELKSFNLINNKHLPESALKASVVFRLQLLAGLLDTDGCYDNYKNTYEFSQKYHHIVLGVKRLAESLGFSCSLGKQVVNPFGNCFRLWIHGEGLEKIPCVLPRKKARPRKQIKNPHRYSFTIEPIGEGEYFGFEVDKDHLFVLGNFVVQSNSGKSSITREIVYHLLKTTDAKIGIVALEESPAETARKLSGLAINRNPAFEEITTAELRPGFEEVFGDERVLVVDHAGAATDSRVLDLIEFLAASGCKYIILDHLTILISEGVGNLEGNAAQDKVVNDLLRLVKRYDLWIGLVSHLRKVSQGQSFEEGRMPSIDDIRGSGSTKQVSFDIIAFARNTIAEDEKERNTIRFRVLKCRYTGLTGNAGAAHYDIKTGRLSSVRPEDLVDLEQTFME
jgi:hypothetical protein